MNKMNLVKISRWVTAGLGLVAAKGALAVTYGIEYGNNVELGQAEPTDIVLSAINWVLGILALIAVIMILIGGFKWMTAGGNEEKVEGAKKLLIAAIIGLVIILAAWGISLYAVRTLGDVTGATVTNS